MLTSHELIEQTVDTLEALRAKAPLVLSITNSVVQPLTANLLLAIGAVPAMLNDGSEAVEMIKACTNALLINVGTLSQDQADAMRMAAEAAHNAGIPWVLDPVAVGLLGLRTRVAQELLAFHPALIRGNASEIMALAGFDACTRGPESMAGSREALDAALSLARAQSCTVLVTGETDYVTDGSLVVATGNGHPMMTRVTGVGCAMGALAGACIAAAPQPNSSLTGAVATAILLGIAGQEAYRLAPHPGSFAVALLDAADMLTAEMVRTRASVISIESF